MAKPKIIFTSAVTELPHQLCRGRTCAVSNAQHVRIASALAGSLGLGNATPDKARAMLAFEGTDRVGFRP